MISEKVIKRMLQYRLCLMKFKKLGFEKIFSYNLGKEAGVTAEQVRKDFSLFELKGNKKGGYEIDELYNSINKIFQWKKERNVILVGMGNIGKALASYKGFPENNINIVAAFDLDPAKQSKKNPIPTYSLDKMAKIIEKGKIQTAIIAVPEIAGQEVCNMLVTYGIKSILNFSPIVLQVPEDVVVNNVNLRSELEILFYYV